jgi:hypothetical protein
VLADTNVCYSITVLDLVLRLDEHDVHKVIWTEDLLKELEDTWVENGVRPREGARKVCDDIRSAFIDQEVPRGVYEHLIDSMPGADSDDHLHSAAAAAVAPATIITHNLRDFPVNQLAGLGVTVLHPDEYLLGVLATDSSEVIDVISAMVKDRTNPPVGAADVLNLLRGAGLPRFAEAVEALVALRI